jgi:crotonobetainyl-CoA:carnitine CoA-transferase CaiB-like acyl-CoA transferase
VPALGGLLKDERLGSNAMRTEHHDIVKKGIEAWSTTLATDEVVEIASGTGVACSPVNTVDKLLQDQNTRQREMLAEFDHPVAGKITTANNPIHFSETPCKEHAVAPVLGQHTEAVLSDVLGYSPDRIESLRKSGAFG